MHPHLRRVLPLVDVVAVPIVLFSALILKAVRRLGVQRVPLCRSILMRVGVFPIRRHYYEPQFDNRSPRQDFAIDRDLPGIDLNEAGQLEFLEQLTYAAELADLPLHPTPGRLEFYLNNASFTSGDAEYLYQVIRALSAYSGAIRPPIPVESGHPFRLNPATCSGRIRPPSLAQSGHHVRCMALRA